MRVSVRKTDPQSDILNCALARKRKFNLVLFGYGFRMRVELLVQQPEFAHQASQPNFGKKNGHRDQAGHLTTVSLHYERFLFLRYSIQ